MVNTTCIISALLLAGSSSVYAENLNLEPASPYINRDLQWQFVEADMLPDELAHATRHNKRLVGDTLRRYSENAFTSIGFSRKNVNLVGAAIGLAVQDARFHLDEKKILALELRDITNSDQAVFLGINVDW